jgi:hypothetical protein
MALMHEACFRLVQASLLSMLLSNRALAQQFTPVPGPPTELACSSFPASNALFDDSYRPLWSCNDEVVGDMWKRFSFEDACDLSRPLGRTFNALQLLAYAGTPNPSCDSSGLSMLDWAYCWAGNAIAELDAGCDAGPGERAYTEFVPALSNYTELYFTFFYSETVVQRAGTLVHEARHADGRCEHAGNCPRGTSCDENYGYQSCTGTVSGSGAGANTYQVDYLLSFVHRARADWTSTPIHDNALDEATEIVTRGFAEDPCWRPDSTGAHVCTCGCGSTSPPEPPWFP